MRKALQTSAGFGETDSYLAQRVIFLFGKLIRSAFDDWSALQPESSLTQIKHLSMLKGIHPAISPELLKTLAEMGHGDEIILADAHFPGHSVNSRVLRLDGSGVATLLDAILPLFELDSYSEPLAMMQAVAGDELDPAVEAEYMNAIRCHSPAAKSPERIERFAFYERAKTAYAIVMTGETAKYGNIILKKGVTPCTQTRR
jgi:L-fucose mutarotase